MDGKTHGLNDTLFNFIQLATVYKTVFIDNHRQFTTGN